MSTVALERPWRLATPLLVVPVVGVILLVAVVSGVDPLGSFRTSSPIDTAIVERTVLRPGRIELQVRNDGPAPLTVAQVLVNDAYWQHTMSDRALGRLDTATVRIAYPWEEGMPLSITLLTSTGATITHEIEAAVASPTTDGRTLRDFALLGVWMGVLPVAVGLLWYPVLRRVPAPGLTFFLAVTVGLLTFLLVDTVVAGVETAEAVPGSLGGVELFALGLLAALAALVALGRKLADPASPGSGRATALVAAYLVAAGIGLHNLGEGLAVGVAVATGQVALGSSLLLGFAVHNTTEGLAIVSPLGEPDRPPAMWHLAILAAVAGAPTVLGSLAGAFVSTPLWATLVFGAAAGAIAAVVLTVGRGLLRTRDVTAAATGFGCGLAVMYLTGLLT